MADYVTLKKRARWDADQCVTTPFRERWWLREAYDAAGKRIGITECCPEDAPCPWHALIAEQEADRG